jgi:hypothetical protein
MAGAKRKRSGSVKSSYKKQNKKLQVATKGFVERLINEHIETKSNDWKFSIPTYYPSGTSSNTAISDPVFPGESIHCTSLIKPRWEQGPGDTEMQGNEVTLTSIMVKGRIGLRTSNGSMNQFITQNYSMLNPLKLRLIIFQYTDDIHGILPTNILQHVGTSHWNTYEPQPVWQRDMTTGEGNQNYITNADAAIDSHYNRKTKGHFKVLYDKCYSFQVATEQLDGHTAFVQTGNGRQDLSIPIDLYIPASKLKRKKLSFNEGTTVGGGVYYEIGTTKSQGGIYAMVVSNACQTVKSTSTAYENDKTFYNLWGFTGTCRTYYKDG